MMFQQPKKTEGKGQFDYLGRWVDIEHFRAFVYDAEGNQQLAGSYDEFLALTQSGIWFASRPEKPEPAKEGGSKDAKCSDSEGLRAGRLPTNKRKQPNSTASRERHVEGSSVPERASEVVQFKQPIADNIKKDQLHTANRPAVCDIR